jgi:hypothetical protein
MRDEDWFRPELVGDEELVLSGGEWGQGRHGVVA